jgi:uncharacterized protein (DUF983 family)
MFQASMHGQERRPLELGGEGMKPVLTPPPTAKARDLPSVLAAGLKGRCPSCGRGRLFHGFLDLAPSCDCCGLHYGFADSGDGPAVFIILIVGFLVVFLALWVEVRFNPPYWVHVVLWVPLILGLSIGLLRPLKGVFVAIQYRNKAAEGRVRD